MDLFSRTFDRHHEVRKLAIRASDATSAAVEMLEGQTQAKGRS